MTALFKVLAPIVAITGEWSEESSKVNVICRYTSSYEKVQQVVQLGEVRRPVCWSASAEIVTIVVGNVLEKVSPFRCDESRSPSGMFRVPVSTNQESRPQGSEERRIFVGRYDVTRRAIDCGYRQGPRVSVELDGCSLYFVRLMV